MVRFIRSYLATILAVLFILIIFISDVDLAAAGDQLFMPIAEHKIARILATFLFIALALSIDVFAASRRAKREAEIQAQRLIVFKATMRTVQEIVNNALNQMQVFRLDAEGIMPEKSLESFDDLIKRTAAEVKNLGDLETTPERESTIGRRIDYKRNPGGETRE